MISNKNRIGVIVGALLVAFGMSPAMNSFGNELDLPGASDAGTGSFTASVAVPPWCGWSQTPAAADLTLTGDGLYIGDAYELQGSSGSVYAYVNGGSSITSQAASDNCSWFNTTPYAAALNMALGDVSFEGTSDAEPGVVDTAFSWDGNLTFTNNFDEGSCTNFTTGAGAELTTAGDVDVWSVASGDTTTNNFCSYSISYGSTIPAGLNPTYGDSTYTIAGPTLTVTLTTS